MPYIGKSPSAGVRQRYQYTATAGQTTFSGTDLGNLTLNYTDNNFVDVFQNGVLLKGGTTDYTATSGTSVVLTTGASVSDVIEIIVYDVFSVGNFFSRTDSDSRYAKTTGATMTGDLTMGDASASDRKILFDGNAQDFHIGLDDSADSLTIGLGSTLGTTSHMVIDANGQVTKPLQCAFFINKSSHQSNIDTDGSNDLVTFDSERFDIGSNFASNTFTAPVTGMYFLYSSLRLDDIDTGATYYNMAIVTSNHTHEWIEQFNTDGGDYTYFTAQVTAIADMDAGDTATVQINQNGGTQQTDIIASSGRTLFSGYLLG